MKSMFRWKLVNSELKHLTAATFTNNTNKTMSQL